MPHTTLDIWIMQNLMVSFHDISLLINKQVQNILDKEVKIYTFFVPASCITWLEIQTSDRVFYTVSLTGFQVWWLLSCSYYCKYNYFSLDIANHFLYNFVTLVYTGLSNMLF